jgi:hypothetical protein
MAWENPFSAPVDPAYSRFEDGWKKWVNDGGVFKNPTLRWHPRSGQWHIYPAPRWELIDRSIPDVDPPSFVTGFALPQLFRNVAAAASKHAKLPNLVWNPFTGDWRDARDTASTPSKPPAPWPQPGPGAFDEARAKAQRDYERELRALNDEYARGLDITIYNTRLAALEDRYRNLLRGNPARA